MVGQRIFHWKSGSRSKLVKCSLGYYFHQFANSPSIKFLLDLVNDLDHKGRPNTLMFLTHNCVIMMLILQYSTCVCFKVKRTIVLQPPYIWMNEGGED